MEFILHCYGGGDIFYYVFQGIASLLGNKETGLLNNMIRLSAMVSIPAVVLWSYLRNSFHQVFNWFLWFLAATNLFFAPVASILITDHIENTVKKVDNVPLGMAALAGTLSDFGRVLTEKVEEVFTLPNYMPYHQTGSIFASRLYAESHLFKITDPDFQTNMDGFVNQCVIYDAMMGFKYTLKDLKNSTDIWKLVSEKASPIMGFTYKYPKTKEGQSNSEIVTCQKGAELLEKEWQKQTTAAATKYGRKFFPYIPQQANALFTQYLGQGYALLAKMRNMAVNAEKILQQEMMINAILEGSQSKLAQFDIGENYAASRALLQQKETQRISGQMAGKVLPIMKNVFEALSYAAILFVLVLSLLPNGYRVLLTYVGMLFWIQIWAPLYAILNLFMTIGAQYKMAGAIDGLGLTLGTSLGIANVNADIGDMAGYLALSIPFISYALVKGGAASFLHLASNISGTMQGAASTGGTELTSGNFSMGNVSMNTLAYQNASGFHHNMSPSHHDGQFEQMTDDGTIKVTQADGSQVFRGGAGHNVSQMALRVNGQEMISEQAQSQLSHANSVMQSQSEELSIARSSGARQAANLMNSLAKGETSAEGFDYSMASNESSIFNRMQKFTTALKEQYGFSEGEATEIAGSVMAGVGTPSALSIASFKAEGSLRGSARADRSTVANEVFDLANDLNLNNSYDEAIRGVKDLKFSDSNSKEARFSKDLGHSIERAEAARESIHKAQQEADTATKIQTALQSGSLNTDRDYSQELLEFTANKTENGQKLGMDYAYKLLRAGDWKAQAITKEFAQHKFQEISARVGRDPEIKSAQALGDLYQESPTYQREAQAYNTKGLEKVDQDLAPVTSTIIEHQAEQQGLHQEMISTEAKVKYDAHRDHISQEIEGGKAQVERESADLDKSTHQILDQSTTAAATDHAISAVKDFGSNFAEHLMHPLNNPQSAPIEQSRPQHLKERKEK